MEFRMFGKKFRFVEGRVEYLFQNSWRNIGKATTLKEAVEHAKFYAICIMA